MNSSKKRDSKNAFMEDIKPYFEELLDIAQRDIRYYRARGDILEGELYPEEVVGETLIRAFEYRKT